MLKVRIQLPVLVDIYIKYRYTQSIPNLPIISLSIMPGNLTNGYHDFFVWGVEGLRCTELNRPFLQGLSIYIIPLHLSP